MRTLLAVSVATLLAFGCKSADKPSPAASSEPAPSQAIRLEIGGQLVTAGDRKVEVRVFDDGHAEALVMDARGKAIADPEKTKVTLKANAKGAPNGRAAIDLAYEPTMARFAGNAGAKVDLEPGPIEVELKTGDVLARGTLDVPVLLVGPELGGELFVAGKYGVEMVGRADGTIEAIVRDHAGVKIEGDAALKWQAKVGGADVKLAWDAQKARFVGKADAGAKLAAGPVEIAIDGAVAATLPKLALRVDASHGGRVVALGEYSVELVAKGDLVTAFVFDASGAAVAKGDLDLGMRVGTGAFVKLAWDAPSLSYKAKIDGNLEVAPITLALKADAKVRVAAVPPSIAVNADARAAGLDAKGKVDAKAKANVKAPNVQANAAIKPVTVNKSANASAGTDGAKASAKAGFSFGTK